MAFNSMDIHRERKDEMSNCTCNERGLAISIGEERNDAGEPLVCVQGVGALGTLDDMKWFIAQYERNRTPVDNVDSKIAAAIAAYDRNVLPGRIAQHSAGFGARW